MDEKTFYTDWYSKKDIKTRIDSLGTLWRDKVYPERQEVLSRLGSLKDKNILCIGNGAREKELYLSDCDKLVISDIAINGISKVKEKHSSGNNVYFCATDAFNIPFKDSVFDIVYGWQMTHHLEDLSCFFSEVGRVLKPGGKAVFVDNAYSPAWQFVKWRMLKKLTNVFLKKRGVSERDLEFSLSGDYKEDVLARIVESKGFKSFKADRFNFLSYVFLKSVRDVFKVQVTNKNLGLYQIAYLLSRIDSFFARRSVSYKRNLRNMVWSFTK